jgi:YD repeat-containing protein
MIKYISGFALLFSFILFSFFSANAQYYYKDILNTLQLNKEFSILKDQQIKIIKLKSFEDNDEPSEGFFCEKKINKNYSQSEMISKSYITGQSLLITDYNADGRVIKTTNSTPTTNNITQYEYDDKGRLTMIRTITSADADSIQIAETHEYTYNDEGKPVKMLRKKNNQLLSTITFVTDDKGNIVEENVEGNSSDKKYFYYYDDKNHLTDVVHYNELAKRLLPDYMFEYNALDEPKQMISIDESGRNYFIWKYAYNDKKLPEIQKCYSKEKRLLGTIEYEYQ